MNSTQEGNTGLSNLVQCGRCGLFGERPSSLAKSGFVESPYVCENCRCKDCSIVLGFECECGERHADRDSDTPEICRECAIIRQRVIHLDPELRRLRAVEIARESRIFEGSKCLSEEDLNLIENQPETGETVN